MDFIKNQTHILRMFHCPFCKVVIEFNQEDPLLAECPRCKRLYDVKVRFTLVMGIDVLEHKINELNGSS